MTLLARGRYFEAPRWHAGRLWVVDTLTREIIALDPAGEAQTMCKVERDVPCGLGVLPDGAILIVAMFGRKVFKFAQGKLALHADLSAIAKGTIDDMIVDAQGCAYVGDLGADLAKGAVNGPIGRIIRIEPDGRTDVVASELDFPNGIAIRNDNLVVAESNADRLARFKIGAGGSLALVNRIDAPREPDGICFDAEDCLWVASFKEDAFVRIDLDGKVLERVPSAGGRGVACALGGPDRRTLFCLSADTTHEKLMRGESSARIDALAVSVPGAGFP